MTVPTPHPGFALYDAQRLIEADAAFTATMRQTVDDVIPPTVRFAHAQTRYELGLPAAALFAAAARALPDHADLTRNHASALASEGDVPAARQLLQGRLARHPGWIDGHRALATLEWTRGDAARHTASFADAIRAQPENADLYLGWFHTVAQTRDWAAAHAILDAAEARLGPTPALQVCRLFVATESGDDARAGRLFAQTAHLAGDTVSLCRIRDYLRHGRPDAAAAEALPHLLSPGAMLYWPYLSLAWRMLDDPRAAWLDRPADSIAVTHIDLSAAELAALTATLTHLHDMQRPYAEQSVRGGTQTDRSVLLRHEPALQHLRAKWMDAIMAYIAALPPHEPGHPLLGQRRDAPLRIDGSWSVRLRAAGHNVPHTHARGWISSTLYVALPDAAAMGAAPAGHIGFGTPPAELGLPLHPYRTVAPAPARLVIFPSTLWHATVPFDDGERLVVAMDIARPGAPPA